MKKKYIIIPLFLGLSLALFLPSVNHLNIVNEGDALAYTSRLEKYRTKAIENLAEVDLTLYRENEVQEINTLRTETIAKINQSEDYAEIDSIVSSYNRYILTIKTDEELTKEEAEQDPEKDYYTISSLDELLDFRDDVNSGYTYWNDTVVLTNDIIIPEDTSFGDPIGISDAKPFSGTFDGKGHKISGLKMSGDNAIGLFSRVSYGTVKNLVIEDVTITSVTQRSAGLVARAFAAKIENVEIKSGTITSAKQSAGIASVTLNNVTITNCINRASVSSTGTSTAGIVGLVYSGTATITNCVNYGTISGKGLGTGGIVGNSNNAAISSTLPDEVQPSITIAHCNNEGVVTSTGEATGGIMGQPANAKNGTGTIRIEDCTNNNTVTGASIGTGGIVGSTTEKSTTFTVTITNCLNNADISGVQYVGGIIGLFRLQTNSEMSDCINKGNISATKTVGVGGVAGFARDNVTDCSCLYSVLIKDAYAYTYPDIGCTVSGGGGSTTGKYGYISGGMGNGAIQSGGILIDENGDEYIPS